MEFVNMLILSAWAFCVWLLGACVQQDMNTDAGIESYNPYPTGIKKMLIVVCVFVGIYLMLIIAQS